MMDRVVAGLVAGTMAFVLMYFFGPSRMVVNLYDCQGSVVEHK